ncbi:MAG: hypothetical protein WDZ76_01835 [Pseudohongiellaceae bacterium]
MNKIARVPTEAPANDSVQETPRTEAEKLFLKKQIEDKIRMTLCQFADEIARVKKQREKH